LPLKGKILNVEKARFDKMLSFEEIRILITALGTGIGPGDFDIEKLRYHKIVIMTDADVDGSHIRTLLLTFFFRQMSEVISRGYLYIAQPPLYKLKKGKTERYIKDESEFTQIIVSGGVEDVTIEASGGNKVKAEDVKDLLVRVMAMQPMLDEFQMERLDRRVIVGLAESKLSFDHHSWKRDDIEKLLPQIESLLKKIIPFDLSAHVVDDHDGEVALKVTTRLRGVRYETTLTRRLWNSDRLAQLRAIYQEGSTEIGEGPFTVYSGEGRESDTPETLEALARWIDQRGRKGLSITRYKGLGEMNPDQLWETTMDPQARMLLLVRVEDAIDADQIFTVLMGDEVEPRRKFIEENALKIRNLDV